MSNRFTTFPPFLQVIFFWSKFSIFHFSSIPPKGDNLKEWRKSGKTVWRYTINMHTNSDRIVIKMHKKKCYKIYNFILKIQSFFYDKNWEWRKKLKNGGNKIGMENFTIAETYHIKWRRTIIQWGKYIWDFANPLLKENSYYLRTYK